MNGFFVAVFKKQFVLTADTTDMLVEEKESTLVAVTKKRNKRNLYEMDERCEVDVNVSGIRVSGSDSIEKSNDMDLDRRSSLSSHTRQDWCPTHLKLRCVR